MIEKRQEYLLVKQSGHHTDVHHIVPRSWGGTELNENKVRLTWREHFVAHKLLVKLAETDNHRYSMLCAVRKMVPAKNKSSRLYQLIKQKWVEEYTKYMLQIIGPNGETRRELTTRKSAATMANTIVDGKSLEEHRFRKMSKHNSVVYVWEHRSGKQFTGTAIDLSRTFRGELIEPYKMTRNLCTPEYHRDWRSVEGGKQPSELMKRYQIVRTWINRIGESFTGTSYELSEYVKPKQTMHPNRIERFALKNARLDGWKVSST